MELWACGKSGRVTSGIRSLGATRSRLTEEVVTEEVVITEEVVCRGTEVNFQGEGKLSRRILLDCHTWYNLVSGELTISPASHICIVTLSLTSVKSHLI